MTVALSCDTLRTAASSPNCRFQMAETRLRDWNTLPTRSQDCYLKNTFPRTTTEDLEQSYLNTGLFDASPASTDPCVKHLQRFEELKDLSSKELCHFPADTSFCLFSKSDQNVRIIKFPTVIRTVQVASR